MTKIRFGLMVFAVCGALLWAGIAGAPGPPFDPKSVKGGLRQCQADLGVCNDVLGTCNTDLATCEASALLPQTGQTTSDESGDDGDIQAGTPLPSPRFTVNNPDGTVTDNQTGLIWLQDANCDGLKNWATALSFANNLEDGDCGLSDGSVGGDWRLPNVREIHSLIHYGFSNPPLSDALGTAQWTTDGDAFTNVESTFYWSSTTNEDNSENAWFVGFGDGIMTLQAKTGFGIALPVRGP